MGASPPDLSDFLETALLECRCCGGKAGVYEAGCGCYFDSPSCELHPNRCVDHCPCRIEP